jgi:hypothetical protein
VTPTADRLARRVAGALLVGWLLLPWLRLVRLRPFCCCGRLLISQPRTHRFSINPSLPPSFCYFVVASTPYRAHVRSRGAPPRKDTLAPLTPRIVNVCRNTCAQTRNAPSVVEILYARCALGALRSQRALRLRASRPHVTMHARSTGETLRRRCVSESRSCRPPPLPTFWHCAGVIIASPPCA